MVKATLNQKELVHIKANMHHPKQCKPDPRDSQMTEAWLLVPSRLTYGSSVVEKRR